MNRMHEQRQGITPEKAQQKLAEQNVNVPTAKAALLLDFLYRLAVIEIELIQKNK